eukprot:CAMPEP_0181290648 /NCGR_PEP_ID=MMETSP1101-20121128/1526_1 /TAXON_ID=46948 /ORGANISM="Rhodomonas abbreviata, Strain Caron Lab Isolate" /LENGTH=244 /DNA_ID=CAMNT_0023394947 /DNA_START=61 /DNA_END=792 /DNA_ORIENTATION=+
MSTNDAVVLMSTRCVAAVVELAVGQPLDRWKMNLQLPPNERLPFTKLIAKGPREWYTASWTSMTQRVFFYIPLIYFANDQWNNNMGTDGVVNNLAKAACISSVVTPGVSCFENLKTKQQVCQKSFGSMSMGAICGKIFRDNGFRKLFPTMGATFAREFMFSGGICGVAPFLHTFYRDNLGVDSYFAAGASAGVICQILSQPFDTIKSWQEAHSVNGRTAVSQISKEGVLFFYKGTLPRTLRGAW